MGRVIEMARFRGPEEEKVIGSCCCCGAELYAGIEFVLWEDDKFCDADCLLDSLNYSYETEE